MIETIANWLTISVGAASLLAGLISIRWAPNADLPTALLWGGLLLLGVWVLVRWVF